MKKATCSLLVLVCISCSNKINFEGKWIILGMRYESNEIYPKTKSDTFYAEIDVSGYEGLEKINFDSRDSTVTFPGFDSERIKMSFHISGDSLYISDFNIKSNEKESKTKDIFKQNYEIVRFEGSKQIGLKSNKTLIKIVNEAQLLNERISDNLLF